MEWKFGLGRGEPAVRHNKRRTRQNKLVLALGSLAGAPLLKDVAGLIGWSAVFLVVFSLDGDAQ